MSTAKSLVQWQNESKRIRVDAWLSLHQELDTDAHEFDPKAIHCQVVNCPGTDVTFIIILAHIYWLIFCNQCCSQVSELWKNSITQSKVCMFIFAKNYLTWVQVPVRLWKIESVSPAALCCHICGWRIYLEANKYQLWGRKPHVPELRLFSVWAAICLCQLPRLISALTLMMFDNYPFIFLTETPRHISHIH